MWKLPVILREMFWSRLSGSLEYTVSGAVISDVGRKRTQNQDNFYFEGLINGDRSHSLRYKLQGAALPRAYALMDGMGGEKLGAQASLEAAGFFSHINKKILKALSRANQRDRERMFNSLVYSMNQRVCQMAQRHQVKQSGTTFVGVFLAGNRAYLISVGDSRIFLIREGAALLQNKLDTIYLSVVEKGRKKEIRGGLSQFLGMDTLEYDLAPHIRELDLKAGDRFLICSDGLTDYVSREEIGERVWGTSMEDSLDILLHLALERGGGDNVTILRLDIKDAHSALK